MMKNHLILIAVLAILVASLALRMPQNIFGAFSDAFISVQVGSGPSANEVLQTDGTNSTWVSTASLGFLSSYDAWTHPATGKSATTSEIQITGGLLSTASTTINTLLSDSSTTTSATTTNLFSTTASSTNLFASVFNFGASLFTLVSNTFTGLGIWDLGGASSLEIPNGSAPTVDATGEIAVDTTDDQLIYYGASKRVIQPFDNLGFAYATSTWTGTTTLRVGPAPANITVSSAYCETDAGTLGVSLYDGTNRALYMPTASTTIDKFTYTASNNSFTAGETIRVDAGTPASTPRNLSCRFLYTYDAN